MALDHEINEEKFNGLNDTLKGEYERQENGSYRLSVVGLPDTGALSRAHDRQKADNAALRQQLADANLQLSEINKEQLRKTGDVATLERQWKEQHAAETKALTDKLAARDAATARAAATAEATRIVAKLTDHTDLLMPHVSSRIRAEVDPDTGAVSVKVLDTKGEPTALTPDDLVKEFTNNKTFSSIIRVSKASGANGSGAERQSGRTNGFGQNQGGASDDLSKASASSLVDRINAKRGQ